MNNKYIKSVSMIRFSWFIKSCPWEDKPTLNSKLSKSTPHRVGIASAPWITVADWGLLSHSVPGDFVPPTVLPLKPWNRETPRYPKTLGVCRRAQCNSQGAALARQHGHQRDIYNASDLQPNSNPISKMNPKLGILFENHTIPMASSLASARRSNSASNSWFATSQVAFFINIPLWSNTLLANSGNHLTMSRRRLWSTMNLLMIFHQIISYQYYSTTPVCILQLSKTFKNSHLCSQKSFPKEPGQALNPHLESCRIIHAPLGPLENPFHLIATLPSSGGRPQDRLQPLQVLQWNQSSKVVVKVSWGLLRVEYLNQLKYLKVFLQ